MGCGVTKSTQLQLKPCNRGNISVPAATAMRAALLIQRWYRQYVAQLEMRRRCTWNIFQSIEYSGQQDHIKLYNFFGYLMDHFSSANSQRNLVSHMFGESDVFQDMEWERHVCYKEIEVLDIYTGPHLSFPLTISNVTELVHAFKNKQKLHARYVLQLLGKTWTLLRLMPNISHVCTCKHKEITICGDLHGHLEDLLLIFYKNGFPSAETPYVFNGDFVDRGKESIEILLVLFAFLLLYPHDVHLNRGNHEDHIVNLRYGFTKEVLGKYQIVDVLWSDPMSQNGCVPNEVRGGGCYWGPDVTHKVLDTHKLQLLIRSHECKQEGYEFCHNGRVLTIFSASNYYDVGSNRGAYIRLGPDLIPHFKQFQSSRSTRELTLRQSVGRTELSALQALRMQLFAHKSDLIHEFQEYDPQCTGVISVKHWAAAVEKALRLALPWRVLRSQLVTDSAQDGTLNYQHWVNQLSVMQPNTEITNTSLLETLYKHHSNLESIFRMIDTDHSGLISFKEFRQTWKLLSSHLQMDISDKAISDLAESIDFNKDGSIDINEFMEAFRLVEHSRAETDAPASPE
ncbi:serine/threonine-protein phosphatase with EF-hands 2 isoform X5 [Sinocyclocheilus rhinocerous]|uniref:serine/threonine-protein phosphatase with EF-hands 2 isoform X5 n=1 Tax=Sinocyclocheilus rhinocerous TaxID=307959 RepID=UPI0007B8F897|nr:PREDICTED: serine/threonine-protein phosphatase with EF-hands 2-like isoform X5 [Sinocyclocheilus rhinocerous]